MQGILWYVFLFLATFLNVFNAYVKKWIASIKLDPNDPRNQTGALFLQKNMEIIADSNDTTSTKIFRFHIPKKMLESVFYLVIIFGNFFQLNLN